MQVNYGEYEIQSLLQKVRIFNREIGSYQLFVINDRLDYVVKLSNGRILIKIEELQDDQRDALTPDQLTAIANRFTSTASDANLNQQATSINPKQNTGILPKKSNSGRAVAIVLLLLVVAFILIVTLNKSRRFYPEKRMTVKEVELAQPTSLLFADGNYRENFWGDEFKVNCTITNKATVATYKDALVRVTYYSKTKTFLGSNDYTIYETFPPNSTKAVELTVESYKNVESIGWKVISAITYNTN